MPNSLRCDSAVLPLSITFSISYEQTQVLLNGLETKSPHHNMSFPSFPSTIEWFGVGQVSIFGKEMAALRQGNSTGYQNLLAPSAQLQNLYSFVFCLRPPQVFAKMTKKQLHIKGPFLNTPTAALRLAKPSDPMTFTNAFPGWSLWRPLVLPRRCTNHNRGKRFREFLETWTQH